jgi:hypothetical protein
MKRRTFIAGLAGAAAWRLAVWAQQSDRVRRIGVLMAGNENDPVRKTFISAFTQALADLGWTALHVTQSRDLSALRQAATRLSRSRHEWRSSVSAPICNASIVPEHLGSPLCFAREFGLA